MPDVTPIVLQQIDLDIVPGKTPPIVHVSEYDTGRQILVNLFKDGYPFGTNSIESYNVKVEGSIGKYGFSENAAWADDAEGVVAIHLTEAMTAIHGRVWTKIKLIKSESMQISTCGFWLDVDRAGVEANTVIGAPGFEEQISEAVDDYLADHEPFFTLPSGGVRNQTLQSDGHDGAKWGSLIPDFAEDPNAPSSGTEFEPVDMSSGVEILSGIWRISGKFSENDTWWSTNKVAVMPGTEYHFINFPRYKYCFDENGVNGELVDSGYGNTDLVYTVPDGVYFIGFSEQGERPRTNLKMYRLTPTPEEETALNDPNLKAPNLSISLQNFKTPSTVNAIVPLKDAKIVNLGDSIFGQFNPPEDISTYLSLLTAADVYNCGFGGTKMATHANANYALFSFHALIDAIVSGDFSAQEAALASSWQNPTTFPVRLATLKSIDFSEVDIVTIAYGTNDWNSGYAIDNEQNPKDLLSYCGAFRYGVEKLLTAYPQIRVYTCTPIFRTQLDENTHEPIQYSDTWQNINGKTLPDFCIALRNVSAEYGFKCIDNYYELGFNKLNRTLYYRENDGTHPSVEGRKRIARNLADGITSVGIGWPVLTLADLPVYNGGVT